MTLCQIPDMCQDDEESKISLLKTCGGGAPESIKQVLVNSLTGKAPNWWVFSQNSPESPI